MLRETSKIISIAAFCTELVVVHVVNALSNFIPMVKRTLAVEFFSKLFT